MPRERTIRTSCVLPSVPTTIHSTHVPWSCPWRASSEYSGSGEKIAGSNDIAADTVDGLTMNENGSALILSPRQSLVVLRPCASGQEGDDCADNQLRDQ